MIEVILMEFTAIISFLYSIWLMFAFFAPMNQLIPVFLWTVGSATIFALAEKKGKIFNLTILLLLLPIRYYNSLSSIFFIAITGIIVFFYTKKSLLKGDHYSYAYTFRRVHLSYIVVFYIRLLLDGFSGSVNHAAPFIIIYVLSSVLLTRTIRHIDSRMEIEKIRRNNIQHLLLIGLAFVLATFDKLRNAIGGFIMGLFNRLIYGLMYPLYWLVDLLMPEKLDLGEEGSEAIEKFLSSGGLGQAPPGVEVEEYEEVARSLSRLAALAKGILILILLGILALIIYRIISKAGSRNYAGQGFTEEREYIKREKKSRGFFNRERYPKEPREQIRYYYRRYLDKLRKADIEVGGSDTSAEVNQKAEGVFHQGIENLREIYIRSRYGDKDIDETTVEEMKDLYRGL